MFCLLNTFALFTNQKQPLKCVLTKQLSRLVIIYTLHAIRQGVHLLVKLQAGGINTGSSEALQH